MNNLNISQIICTRISHDLIGNIGAFANAMELLEDEDDDFLQEIKSTLKMSSDILNARLKFFRLAFGLNNESLYKNEIVYKFSEDYLKTLNPNYPVKLIVDIKDSNFNREIMLSIMSIADTLIRGGTIEVKQINDKFIVSAGTDTNTSVQKIEVMKSILEGIIPDSNISIYAPFLYLLHELQKSKKNVEINNEDKFSILIK